MRLDSNARTFQSKRKDVWIQTQGRFTLNALAFFIPLSVLLEEIILHFFCKTLAYSKIMRTFAPVIEKRLNTQSGWPVRLSVRTQDFHSWKGGSIPPRATEKNNAHGTPVQEDGPFVYRLGRKIFILERGVRFPHGLLKKITHTVLRCKRMARSSIG